jgi:hypothetical protein
MAHSLHRVRQRRAMNADYYLIDSQLGAKPLSAYLARRQPGAELPDSGDRLNPGAVAGEADATALPLSPDGSLKPGQIYASSSADPKQGFYLPAYTLRVAQGRYTSSLKWRAPTDDPNGPLAFLTLELTGQAPVSPPGVTLLEIPHQVVARLGYRMPVKDGPAPAPTDSLMGTWRNVDANTRGLTRLDIGQDEELPLTFHAWGKCEPQDCDWGVTKAVQDGDGWAGVFRFGFVTTTVRVRWQGSHLVAQVHDQFAPGDPRGTMDNQYELAPAASSLPDTRPVLWLEVGALQPGPDGVRRCRLPLASKPDFDRLYSVMTDASFEGRLELRLLATAGRRTWRQIILRNPSVLTQKAVLDQKLLFTDMVDTKALNAAASDPKSSSKRVVLESLPAAPLKWIDVKKLTSVHGLAPVAPAAAAPSSPAARTAAFPVATRVDPRVFHRLATQPTSGSQPTAATPLANRRALGSVLAQAYRPSLQASLPASDLTIKAAGGRVKAVPVQALLNEKGQPALLRISVETVETIAPFSFPLATNAYMFDIPGDITPQTNHILIRMAIRDGGGQVVGVFYQDSAYDDLFYYAPKEFRLPRLDTAPYLPDLRVAFFDVVTQDGAGGGHQAELEYRVRLAYCAVPYLDPMLLSLAQQQVSQVRARFNALTPESSQLTLRLPQDETNGDLADSPRPEAEIHFDLGVIDEIELSRTEFERVFAFFQSPSGTGVDGTVDATLLGNVKAAVPVRLSLKENAGSILTHTYKGPQGAGRHRVSVKNPTESVVRIEGLYVVALGNGILAYPQASPGMVLAPGAETDLDYQVAPADAVLLDLSPALSLSIQADPAALWPLLFVNSGYTSDTFKVPLSIEPGFFGPPPAGQQPITAVSVVFDSGTEVVLTAAHLATEVHLPIPLLPRLLGAPEARQYRWQVTNQHGDPPQPGASTGWLQGEGEAPLVVVPAGA